MRVAVLRRTASNGAPRVLLTRDEDGCRAWSEELLGRGIESVSLPCLEHLVTDEDSIVDGFVAAVAAAEPGDWLVFTSRRGVEAADSMLSDADLSQDLRIAAVGPATADACREAFGRCDLAPDEARGTSLASALAQQPPATALLGVARRGRRDVEETLTPLGWTVRRFDLYGTISRRNPPPSETELHVDAVFLASPSAVEGFLACARAASDLPLLAIGPTTAQAIRSAGREVAGVADRPGLDGLVGVLIDVLSNLGSQPVTELIGEPP